MLKLSDVLEYTRDLKVLYIEDDENLLYEMQELLLNFFQQVTIAKDGLEGLHKYKKSKFDIVISDVKLPKVDGIELTKQIKKLNFEQEIIIISAYNDAEILIPLIKIGVSDFILKPLDFEQLVNILYKTSKNVMLKRNQEKYLIQQEKLSIMGEMLDMIAHQWLGILNVLNLKIDLLGYKNKQNILKPEDISKFVQESNIEIDELVSILEELRNFFKEKDKKKISLVDIIDSCLVLLNDYLIKNQIKIELDIPKIELNIYPNEFKQVIINIINNMVEVFNERGIKDRKIKIYIEDDTLCIEDNGGGIDDEIIDKIFDKNFTTKENGSGVGLYLAKKIMEKIGDIEVENSNIGAKFKLKVNDGFS